jgi:uncharacterized protein YecE (DUF72 family)
MNVNQRRERTARWNQRLSIVARVFQTRAVRASPTPRNAPGPTEPGRPARENCRVPAKIHIGTAGWSIPRAEQSRFPAGDSHLARYARVFSAVEINSTFHRPHRASTFARWAASVPRPFRFSVKVPRTITHDQRLTGTTSFLDAFLADVAPLGTRLGCLLVQLPPSLAFDARVARGFFTALRRRFARGIALEPRHPSWFTSRADRLLTTFEVARVAADPPRVESGGEPGGWRGLAYFRLHGSPRIYYSSYEADALDALAETLRTLRRRRIPTWCIFDNTTLGAGTGNALSMIERLHTGRART